MAKTRIDSKGKPGPVGFNKDQIFARIMPHLWHGLSVHKACQLEEISPFTVYDWISTDEVFAQKIEAARNKLSSIAAGATGILVMNIGMKIAEGKRVSKDEVAFFQWAVTNLKITQGEFGPKALQEINDPHQRIQRLTEKIDDAAKTLSQPTEQIQS